MEQLSFRRVFGVLAVGLAALSLAWLVPATQLPEITRIVVLAATAMSLNLLIGNAGLVSIGHGLFLGAGAYVFAIANIRYGWSLGWGVLAAIVFSLLLGAVSAIIALRARALFFALLTLALGQVGFVFTARNYDLTGGDDGLVGVTVPDWIGSDVDHHILAVLVATLVCLALLVLLASPFGATLRAVRDNSDRVASLGANPRIFEFTAFVIAGVFGSMMGIVAAITENSVVPDIVSWTTGATLLVMVALGGRFTFFGPILGAIILETARTFVQSHSSHADFFVGLLVICCALAFPEGIVPRLQAAAQLLWDRRSGATKAAP
jgi:branched-chain amino acid transport system permease protein